MRTTLWLTLAACSTTTTKGTPTASTGDTGSTSTTTTTTTTKSKTAPTPIDKLQPGAWQYVALPGMQCANGSPTGIGVNPGTDLTKLLVLVAGGGACWDALTCFGDPKTGAPGIAVNIENDWGAAELTAETASLTRAELAVLAGLISGWDVATWLYVPYCTGDVHAGDAVQAYDKSDPKRLVHHAGDANWQAWLDYATSELPAVDSLWVNGISAGGYGAQMQADRLVAAWPTADIAVLGDGAAMVNPTGTRLGVWQAAWSIRAPAGCTACATEMSGYVDDALGRSKTLRLGLTTSAEDRVIQGFFDYATGPDLTVAIDALTDDIYAKEERAWGFVAAGNRHVLVPAANTITSRGGEPLNAWYIDFMNGAKPVDAL